MKTLAIGIFASAAGFVLALSARAFTRVPVSAAANDCVYVQSS